MIKCPNCQFEEISGALFCSNCGAQLVFHETNKAPASKPSTQERPSTTESSSTVENPLPPAELMDYPALIYVVDYKDYIPVSPETELTLGRASKDQPIVPDIDLKSYNAYDEGVSRLHATIKVSPEEFYIVDLGSVNGTKVNGERIRPNKKVYLEEGDLISLGRLKLQIIFND